MLDTPTLFISLVGFTLLTTLLLVAAASFSDAPREMRFWAAGNVLSCGGLLVGGWTAAPVWVHAVFSYGLLGLGLGLVLQGLLIFGGRNLAPRYLLLGVLAALLLPGWYALFEPSFNARLVVTGVYFGAINLLCAAWLLRLRRNDRVEVACAGFTLLGLTLLTRAALLGLSPVDDALLQTQLVGVTLLVITLSQVSIAFGLLLMVTRRYARSLRQLAELDPLTGALNRQGLERQGQRLLQRAELAQQPVALAMIDADHFKVINDRHGHPAGDAVIRHLAEQLRASLRLSDALVRYGGEEFLLLLDGVDATQALLVGERLRSRIERTAAGDAELAAAYTVSIGLSCSATLGYDLKALVQAADEALYRAKAAGRNRVMV